MPVKEQIRLDREKVHAAQQMLTAFFVLAKTARVYESDNESYRSRLNRFYNLLRKYMGESHNCTVKLVSERFFVDDQFVKIDSDDRIGVRPMMARWNELGIGGLAWGDSVTPEHTTILIRLLAEFKISSGNPWEQLNNQLAHEGVDSILIMARTNLDDEQLVDVEERQRIRQEARTTFFRAIATVKDVMVSVDREEAISVARTKRVVHTIIDKISEDESALIELASIKDFDEYTYAHSVNVSIYSLALGFRLGLDRRALSELGLAALFHDIGKTKLPRDLITKKDRFDESDWAQMRRHPALGAMTLAKTLSLDSNTARAMAVAYEHHINLDGSGYPALPEPRLTNLYSRIVSIADSFDALTSGRVYIKTPISPDEALGKLVNQISVKFDPFLMRLFVNMIGIYPVGSLVLLTDKSLGLVTRANRDECDRPMLRIIADPGGHKKPPQWCDLTDPDRREVGIVRLIDPKEHDIDLTGYILSD